MRMGARGMLACGLGLVMALMVACDRGSGAGPAGGSTGGGGQGAGLDGLYFRMMSSYNGRSFSFSQDHWFFTPDGRYYHDVPEGGPEGFDWAKAEQKEPKYTGKYEIADGVLTLRPAAAGSKPTTMPIAREKDGNLKLGGIFTKRVDAFKKGQTLSGHYSYGAVAGGGTSAVASTGQGFTFNADGTFTSSNIGGASISAGGQSYGAKSSSESKGTYELAGNTMTLKHADGRVTKHTVYPYDLGEGRVDLNVDGKMFKKAGK